MRELSAAELAESVTLFWRKDETKFRPESCYYSRARDAVIWAFENLHKPERWTAYLRFENDHRQVRIDDLEETYRSLRSN